MQRVPLYKLIMYRAGWLWQIHLYCQFLLSIISNVHWYLQGWNHMKQECTDVSKWHSDLRGREFLFRCSKHVCPWGGLWVAVRGGWGGSGSLINQFISELLQFLFHSKFCAKDWSPCRSYFSKYPPVVSQAFWYFLNQSSSAGSRVRHLLF